MKQEPQDFPELFQLIGGYFHQDMDLEHETVPEAISAYARVSDESTKAKLIAEMARFLLVFKGSAEQEFKQRYWQEINVEDLEQTVPEFFDMVRAILTKPDDYRRFE
ncbi:hypothetical protein HB779_12150 [Phyllobacterium sp. 628]|uniref:contact-dependent growth inhibition system immunity protein n=1 Tax=Phyllobacterium sp. 628 TaxID=2718938 RepID=UPI00166233E4|nr:contact-dependent growth inhibition system immunity protein [Phyllobacterium sp. 628]QND52570.1 hypothetical protein HB779_12150 [Phyllobacterium sp. 628]